MPRKEKAHFHPWASVEGSRGPFSLDFHTWYW